MIKKSEVWNPIKQELVLVERIDAALKDYEGREVRVDVFGFDTAVITTLLSTYAEHGRWRVRTEDADEPGSCLFLVFS